jgi:hypothetical protein
VSACAADENIDAEKRILRAIAVAYMPFDIALSSFKI